MLSGECKVVYVSKHSCPKNAYAIRDKVEHVSLTDEKLVPQANAFRYSLGFFQVKCLGIPVHKVNVTHFTCTLRIQTQS